VAGAAALARVRRRVVKCMFGGEPVAFRLTFGVVENR
jgi:hypothetical protein